MRDHRLTAPKRVQYSHERKKDQDTNTHATTKNKTYKPPGGQTSQLSCQKTKYSRSIGRAHRCGCAFCLTSMLLVIAKYASFSLKGNEEEVRVVARTVLHVSMAP